MTPFKALYGCEPPVLLRGGGEAAVEEGRVLMGKRNQMLDELRFQLQRVQNRMKTYADHKRREEFYEGEHVYLKLQPYRMKTLARRINQKLSARFYSPYEVLEKIGQVVYKLKLPQNTRVHPVFHVSLLKKCVNPSTQAQPLLTALTEEYELQVEPEDVLAVQKNGNGDKEVLIKWKDLPTFENS